MKWSEDGLEVTLSKDEYGTMIDSHKTTVNALIWVSNDLKEAHENIKVVEDKESLLKDNGRLLAFGCRQQAFKRKARNHLSTTRCVCVFIWQGRRNRSSG